MAEHLVPSDNNVQQRLEHIDQLKSFLVTAPDGQQEPIKQHMIPTTGEHISCVKWDDTFYISGTDIVRSLVFRFLAFGRPVQNAKKFEEGIFSDLRNLKPGTDAILEEPKSAFLDLLFKHNCIRTQKKQKVFYWFSVPHDRLFLDALERDLKREKMGIEPTSTAVAHPAVAISLDTTQAMFDEFRKAMLCELNLEPFFRQQQQQGGSSPASSSAAAMSSDTSSIISDSSISPDATDNSNTISGFAISSREGDLQKASSTIFGQFSLFEGSPTYKQRKRRVTSNSQQRQQQQIPSDAMTIYNNNDRKKSSSISDINTWSSELSSSSNNNTDDDAAVVRHFNCPLSTCGKVFKRLEHMKRHLRTHTMERPYLCDLCGRRFSRSDNLAQHKKTHERSRHSKGGNGDRSSSSRGPGSNSGSGSRSTGGGYRGGSLSSKSFSSSRRRGGSGGSSDSNTKSYSRPVNHSLTARREAAAAASLINTYSNSRSIRRHANQHRHFHHRQSRGNDVVEAEVMYESDWSQHQDNIEYIKAEPAYQQQQSLQPELSNSTASSSAASSCDSSPTTYSRLPIIKIEDAELFYDLSAQQQQMNDTAMMMVEELLPQPNQYWEDESASDWQRRVDWNQYSSPKPNYNVDDLIFDSYQQSQEEASFYYINQASQYHHYASNSSSCLASPINLPAFVMGTTASNSTATTAASSPHYFAESPTMTPSDALLQH